MTSLQEDDKHLLVQGLQAHRKLITTIYNCVCTLPFFQQPVVNIAPLSLPLSSRKSMHSLNTVGNSMPSTVALRCTATLKGTPNTGFSGGTVYTYRRDQL